MDNNLTWEDLSSSRDKYAEGHGQYLEECEG